MHDTVLRAQLPVGVTGVAPDAKTSRVKINVLLFERRDNIVPTTVFLVKLMVLPAASVRPLQSASSSLTRVSTPVPTIRELVSHSSRSVDRLILSSDLAELASATRGR